MAALVWLPGQQTPIHDHTSWCVAGGYRGLQRQADFAMIERNWKLCLVSAGTFQVPAGHVDVVAPPAENIHSVRAVGEGKTISIAQLLPGPDRRFRAA